MGPLPLRLIVFSSQDSANAMIDKMRMIHTSVENKRGFNIPDWAYRDVLFMLIHYSISSFEILDRKLTAAEKEEAIARLERDRARKIRAIRNAAGTSDDDYKDVKKNKSKKAKKAKSNNGNHYGWEKGKGNPHKNGGSPKDKKKG